MGKVDLLLNRVEPFAALFSALGIVHCVQYLPTPDPARQPGIAPPLYSQHFLIFA